ncbi:hypothetical protein TRFO_38908 [Tritrichomonas foetus]|uniref:Uncharacterized protein n=1 Tax=Tritrichomonas foetus TaxID=1144522 RepID=A0A1J4JBZ4_9EUKA|nr:hypothetical protein TRFO_38908 [Tritrichomonas foetus]|eukprot:OHS94933.1 hypothetical protein TRFO_38908 [Tritrichomonas foetus]
MISQEELEIVKAKINDFQERVNAIHHKVLLAQHDNADLILTKQKIQILKNNMENDQESYTRVKSELESQIKISKEGDPDGKKRIIHLKKKLESLEEILVKHIEKMEAAQNAEEIFEEKCSIVSEKDEVLSEKVSKLEKKVYKFHQYKKEFPKSAPVLLHVVDLESHLHFYASEIVRVKNLVKSQTSKIQSLNEDNEKALSELNRVQSNVNSIYEQVRENDENRTKLYNELSELNEKFTEINLKRKEMDDEYTQLSSKNRIQDSALIGYIQNLRERLSKLHNEVMSLPDVSRHLNEEQSMEILKKKQLQIEIQKKIDSALLEITQKNSKSPQVLKLSKELEKSWKEFEELEDKSKDLESKLYRAQDLLERKKNILSEIRRQVVKKPEKHGIEYLNRFYEEVKEENHKLEMKMRSITRDLEIYQSEHGQFLLELGMKK